VKRLEFWPDYGSQSPLWSDGREVDLASVGLSESLRSRIEIWCGRYSDDKLPIEGRRGD